ncbi:hypothetical protein D3C72_2596930 [compost metagenome]
MDATSKYFIFELTDMSGSQILINKNNAHQIDISNLKPGVYFGTVIIENEKVTKKIIIE